MIERAPTRTVVPVTLMIGSGTPFDAGSKTPLFASRKSPATLIVVWPPPVTSTLAPRAVKSEQTVNVPGPAKVSVPPFRTCTAPYVPGVRVCEPPGATNTPPPPHVMGEGIGQKGVVKGSRTGDVTARTIAPTQRWIGWLVSTRNTLTPFARLTKSPTRSLPSVTHESRP